MIRACDRKNDEVFTIFVQPSNGTESTLFL